MPRQAPGSPRLTPRSSPSIRADDPPRSHRGSVRCSKARYSLGLTLALSVACRTAPVAVSEVDLSPRARIIRIEDTRRIEAAFLDSALRTPDASVRRAAALAAGRVGARAQSAVLRTLTTDPDARVAAAAFYALGLIRDTAAVALAASSLRGTSDVASEAAWMLGEVGEAGRAALLAVAVDSTLDSRRRGPAILAIARLRPPPAAPLLPLLVDADIAIAWRAAYVVARARSAAAAGAMIAATASASPVVRDYAARGL